MRRFLVLTLCLLGVVSLSLLVRPAFANEVKLGTIYVTDAGLSSNLLPMDGGAFAIQGLTLLTVQPDANAYVCVNAVTSTNRPTCSSDLGVTVASGVGFPTSCPPSAKFIMADAGIVSGCVVVVQPVSGASVAAKVFSRLGNEF